MLRRIQCKATLDVLINEYGKTTLPYASKSGGEKVKASLAVILALSEIKATAAGIQLGMLFIDEPPFLDDEGAQAYVDALVATGEVKHVAGLAAWARWMSREDEK